MVKRRDILSLSFLKKSPYTGSHQGMRYRLKKFVEEQPREADTEDKGGTKDKEPEPPRECLLVEIWPEPYSYEKTAQEKKESQQFEFSEEGINQAVEWLNQQWDAQKERWLDAPNHW